MMISLFIKGIEEGRHGTKHDLTFNKVIWLTQEFSTTSLHQLMVFSAVIPRHKC